uniref:E3 ubiquitin-protein ligase RBBP6-like n=1 Tax=Arvicanthis niloticus TaxID=61156 RepID=UPI00148691CE|nr:E3 ubiquitin-protein ligase RBBP6-like [Arvicanthis niloticus]
MGTTKAVGDSSASLSLAQLTKTVNLAEANASEEDKIKAMMLQSGHEYNPINYMKKSLVGLPPPSYTCFRFGKPGHYIKNCPTNGDKNFATGPSIKKSTGIPTSFMMEVKDPNMKGAMLTNSGKYAIPIIDAEAYAIGKKEKPPFLPEEPSPSSEEGDPIPEELLCLICKDIPTDAVVIPCCGNSYCDECIRTALLESDEHTCPTCHENDVSPDALVANKSLRQAVNNFKNKTGYTKRLRKQWEADGVTRLVVRDLTVTVWISEASFGWCLRLPSVHRVAAAAWFCCRHQQQAKGISGLFYLAVACSVQSLAASNLGSSRFLSHWMGMYGDGE